MITPEEFAALRERNAQMRRERERAAGALAETMKRLKKDFGLTTLKQAETVIKQLQREGREIEAKLQKVLAELGSHDAGRTSHDAGRT